MQLYNTRVLTYKYLERERRREKSKGVEGQGSGRTREWKEWKDKGVERQDKDRTKTGARKWTIDTSYVTLTISHKAAVLGDEESICQDGMESRV
jgi:hypothetical protein